MGKSRRRRDLKKKTREGDVDQRNEWRRRNGRNGRKGKREDGDWWSWLRCGQAV